MSDDDGAKVFGNQLELMRLKKENERLQEELTRAKVEADAWRKEKERLVLRHEHELEKVKAVREAELDRELAKIKLAVIGAMGPPPRDDVRGYAELAMSYARELRAADIRQSLSGALDYDASSPE